MLRGWTTPELFLAAAVPAVASTAVMFSMRWVIGPRGASRDGAPSSGGA
jgi:hypothetical protein